MKYLGVRRLASVCVLGSWGSRGCVVAARMGVESEARPQRRSVFAERIVELYEEALDSRLTDQSDNAEGDPGGDANYGAIGSRWWSI